MVYPAIQVVSLTDTYLSKKRGKRSSFQSNKLKELNNASLQRRIIFPGRRFHSNSINSKHNHNITKNIQSSPYIGYLRHAPSLRNTISRTKNYRHLHHNRLKESIVCDKSSPYVGFIRHAPPSQLKFQVNHSTPAFTSTITSSCSDSTKHNAFFALMKMTAHENLASNIRNKDKDNEEAKEERKHDNAHNEKCLSSSDNIMLLRYPELSNYISGRLPGGSNPLLSYYSLCKWFVETEIYSSNNNSSHHDNHRQQQQQHNTRNNNNYHDHMATFDIFQSVVSWLLFPIAYDISGNRIDDDDIDAYMENLRRGLAFLSSFIKRLLPGRHHPLLICTGVQMDGNTLVPITSSLYNSNHSSSSSDTHNSGSTAENHKDTTSNDCKEEENDEEQEEGGEIKDGGEDCVVGSTLFPPNHPLHVSVSSLAKAYHVEQARAECSDVYSSENVVEMSSEDFQRHLDVESILRLPTLTYKSKRNSIHKDQEEEEEEVEKNDTQEIKNAKETMLEEEEKKKLDDEAKMYQNNNLEWSWIAVPTDQSNCDDEGKDILVEQSEDLQIDESNAMDEQEQDDQEEERCAICLESFNDGDRLRVLPCGHNFHTSCIDKWLSGSFSDQDCFTSLCPMCKKVPTVDVLSNSPSFEVEEDDSMGTMGDDMRMEGIVPSWAFARLGGSIAKEN